MEHFDDFAIGVWRFWVANKSGESEKISEIWAKINIVDICAENRFIWLKYRLDGYRKKFSIKIDWKFKFRDQEALCERSYWFLDIWECLEELFTASV